MTLKRAIFWLHLVTGLFCGTVIALLAATGATYAFQGEILAYARRDVARVQPADTRRLTPDDILAEVRKQNPETKPSGLVAYSDPGAAVLVMMGRDKPSLYANPYTGEIRPDNATGAADFFAFTLRLHRWLALGGEGKKVGAAITGACSAAFLFLSLSGLWLWWPRNLRALKPATSLIRGARGKVRDWNWHNVFGFRSLPLLIVLSSTGMIMSYRWASNALYIVAGETPPPPRKTGQTESPGERLAPPAPGDQPISRASLLAIAAREEPRWASISLRFDTPSRREKKPATPEAAGDATDAPPPRRREGAREKPENAPGAAPVSIIVRRADALPLTAVVTLTINPYTGEVMKREGFAEKSLGEKLRGAVRPVHTGEGFGWPGQLVMMLGACAALVLVYTGFALSRRRFLPGKKSRHHQHRDESRPPHAGRAG